jgi:hypothetical protein
MMTTATETVTIREKLVGFLIEHGMFDDDAEAIMAQYVAGSDDGMRGRWGDPCNTYPDFMIGVLVVSLKSVAFDWLKANKPNHWAIGAFE